ncbi:lipoprotein [Trinickia caryophylli]|uniref:Lipoprotein n=2 Tax=Trinickia caryophylli TaxID=28094 RepID=A0A1X7DXD3_TRICW|nr:lipoprotein [Trinickia caryophylli]SMF23538.1 hypothetical protein SAMN06295900_104205 [Trinickia caryophylli]
MLGRYQGPSRPAARVRHASARRWAGAAAAALVAVLAGCSAAADMPAAPGAHLPRLEADKARALEIERAIAMRLPSAGGMTLARTRPFTLRDSGIDATLLFARDVDFRVTGELGFEIRTMAATLAPAHDGVPIVFDDPASVTIRVHRGEVVLDAARLTAVFDRYLFGYRGSPLRRLRVTPQAGTLRISGEMWRGAWVPIELMGTLATDRSRGPDTLIFHATHVSVAGVAADALMRAAHVRMADLLTIRTPLAQLAGDDVVMRASLLMPPPALDMTVAAVNVTSAGVALALDDGTLQGIDWPSHMPARGMLLVGGDVKFMRSMPMNIDLALVPLEPFMADEPFRFDLYRYREQLAAGFMTFDERGALTVHVPSAAALAGANERTSLQGSARAQFNDALLRRQQRALAAARAQWRASTAEVPAAAASSTKEQAQAAEPADARAERGPTGGPTRVHIENVDYFVAGRIGFHVRTLDAQMVPKRAGEPVDLDDPNQYDVRILAGEVIEPWPAMTALFNEYLLDYAPRSLNGIELVAHEGQLQVNGGVKLWNRFPGVWMPLALSGGIEVLDGRHIAYTPTRVEVLGVPQAGLLRALGVQLSSLTPFDRKGARLDGNRLVFDQYTVFPPPALMGELERASVTDEGLVLKFRRQPSVALSHPPAGAGPSYVWIEGGDVKMFDSLVVNARALIRDTSSPTLRFDLYGYRRDVSRGAVRMALDGTLDVSLAQRADASPPDWAPMGAAHGAAAVSIRAGAAEAAWRRGPAARRTTGDTR